MKELWAPWRIEYIESEKPKECIFCVRLARRADEADLILERGERAFTILNRYPYNPGHLMVVPNLHAADFEELDEETEIELFRLMKRSITALRGALKPHGFNIGANLGLTAGAGIEDHVHLHVVPRWNGDTNFMPVVAGARVLPEHLSRTYAKLRRAWPRDGSR
ncbi:MAG: HIT domain-containing protein [Planctomycetota bacterium]